MQWSDIPGWFDFQQIYKDQVDAAPQDGAVFVELGSYLGQSTACMAQLIKDSGKKITFYAVDLWANTPDQDHKEVKYDIYDEFVQNMIACGVADIISTIKASTSDAAAYFKKYGVMFDFVFIDANHTYEYVRADIKNYKPLIKPGGVLAGHDIYFADVRRAVDELIPQAEILPSCFRLTI